MPGRRPSWLPPDGEPESSDGEEPRDADSPEESLRAGRNPEEEPSPNPVYFNVPDELRAVMISAGTDYLTTDAPLSAAELGGQLDRGARGRAGADDEFDHHRHEVPRRRPLYERHARGGAA